MNRLTTMTVAYAAGMIIVGLSLIVGRGHSPLLRLVGVQTTAAGIYLVTLAKEGRLGALRWVFFARLLLALAMALALWFGGGAPDDPTSGVLSSNGVRWPYLLFALDGAWLFLLARVAGKCSGGESRHIPAAAMPSALHNIFLGLVPFSEAVGILLLGSGYATLILGLDEPGDRADAWWFGLCSLNLAVFWIVSVLAGARATLVATLWGRVGVALAFLVFWASGVGGEQTRLLWLAPLLVMSSVWTALELFTRALPWQRTTTTPESGDQP